MVNVRHAPPLGGGRRATVTASNLLERVDVERLDTANRDGFRAAIEAPP